MIYFSMWGRKVFLSELTSENVNRLLSASEKTKTQNLIYIATQERVIEAIITMITQVLLLVVLNNLGYSL